jgi:AcrR family transcriptional regulator
MARMTPAQRREEIIKAAVSVMLGKGMAATTVRDVADRMGTSSGLIHHYFASMDDLLAAAFDRAAGLDLDLTRSAMAARSDPLERLAAFFATYARADQTWAFQLWLDAWAEAARRPAVRATSQRLNVAWQRLLAETITDGVGQGEMACRDPEGAAWRILSLLDGLALQVVAHSGDVDPASVISWSVVYAESELGLVHGTIDLARSEPQAVMAVVAPGTSDPSGR